MSEKQSIEAEALHGKAVALTAKFLKRRGYEVVESGLRRNGFPFDIVAREGKTTAFVEVAVRRGGAPSLEKGTRAVVELSEAAARYAEEHGLAVNGIEGMRLDLADVCLVEEDKGFLRHYLNAFEPVLGKQARSR